MPLFLETSPALKKSCLRACTGLLNIQDSMCAINKTLKKDLRGLSFWLNPNKVALNVVKGEIIIFKTSNKNYDAGLRIKLCRKRIHACIPVCYISRRFYWWKPKLEKTKVSSMSRRGQWGKFTVKNATLFLHILSWHFFCFLSKYLGFYLFNLSFW